MNKPSRRAVVRTGVWAVPAVATVAAAPAFATGSNEPPPVTVSPDATSCKLPGQSTDFPWSYRIVLTFTNTTGGVGDATVVVDSFNISGSSTTNFTPTAPLGPIADGDSLTVVYIVSSHNSAQRNATITYSVNGVAYTQPIVLSSFNPCKCDGDPSDPATSC